MTASKYVTTRIVDTHAHAGMDTRWMANLIALVGSIKHQITLNVIVLTCSITKIRMFCMLQVTIL